MTRQEILAEIVNAIVATKNDIDGSRINNDTTFGMLELDSVTLVELSVRLEEQFGEAVDLDTWVDEQADAGYTSFTVGSLATFIENVMNSR